MVIAESEKLKGVTHIHFIGVYGISLSALAVISAKRGYVVSGSDVGKGSDNIRRQLEEAGVTVLFGNSSENLSHLPSAPSSAVVYSAAVTDQNRELAAARSLGMRVFGRAEFMELITSGIGVRIGVSGTHGKSTVCGMITEILLAAGLDPDVLCGAVLPSLGGTWRVGSGQRIVYEACEYKNSFLQLHPTCAVVTNIEEDHPDFFSGIGEIREAFDQFAGGAEKAVVCVDGEEGRELAMRLGAVTCSAFAQDADYFACDTKVESGRYSFTLCHRGERLCEVSLKALGIHNLQNAVTAAATALEEGVLPEFVTDGLGNFTGVRRRMEYRGMLKDAVIYDDYAHHPTEIRATLAAFRAMGFRFISCAFQPHTFSRTKRFFCDFATAFADADEVIFADIFAARETDTYGINSRDLASVTKNGYYLPTPELIAQHFRNIAAPGVLLLTMGAGELDRVADELLKNS